MSSNKASGGRYCKILVEASLKVVSQGVCGNEGRGTKKPCSHFGRFTLREHSIKKRFR